MRKVDGVKAMSQDSVAASSDFDRQILLGWWRHHLGASPTGTCHGQPPSAASLIHSLALQHSPNRSSQPTLQESCKFTCGTHQLSAYIPMPFHICEYSLSKGGGPPTLRCETSEPRLTRLSALAVCKWTCSSSLPRSQTQPHCWRRCVFQTQTKYLDLSKREVR